MRLETANPLIIPRSLTHTHTYTLYIHTRSVFWSAFLATGGGQRTCFQEGLALLGASVVRPEKYNAKFLPQEYSLLHKIWTLLGPDSSSAGVLDIGAGNANCAVLAAALLGLTVICVERESPRIELRAEELLPPSLRAKVRRLEMDIAELDVATLKALAKQYGLQRFVLVAKHPCGIGVDRSIDCALQLVDAPEDVDLMGVVIATCCSNKLSLDDFRESRVQEFCDLNSRQLGSVTPDLVKAVELMSKCTAWRSAAQSLGNAISDEQITYAQIFEDHLQALRVQKLAQAFGAAKEVRFAPRSCTLQDRCLIGCPDLDLPSEGFLERLREGVQDFLRLNGGPMDCRRPGAQGTQVQQVRLRLLRRLLSTDPRTCAPLPSQVTSTAQTWSQRAYVTWDHDTTWSPQLDWRFTVRDTNRGLLAGTWQEVGSDDKGAETDPKKNSFLMLLFTKLPTPATGLSGHGPLQLRQQLRARPGPLPEPGVAEPRVAGRGAQPQPQWKCQAQWMMRRAGTGWVGEPKGGAGPRARPICFKVEQRFRALRFPEIQRTLRAALRARAGGLGLITYSKQGCHLDPPEGEPWPAPDQEDHSDRGQDEVGSPGRPASVT
ncbi:tRNA:m(4)X modification enzyme TRM13 [Durusdinium trenchii]|uniref:tRNA:m(4)X modification enzyme TRM13 n=1 Tax=Durusdinium trenchii TaxID=1381693 RepID=A0ABP0MG33_9DINO